MPAWVPRAIVAVALVALVAWSAWQRWRMLMISPFPVGIDGYFYPVELRSLLETGHLQYPASPLAFYWMLPFAAATDPITGAKLGAALGGALVAIPAYFAGARLGRSRGAGLVAAAVATTSVGSAYLTVEFVKNGIGLTVALAALALVLRAVESPRRATIAAAALATLAALLTHKMAAALVVVVAGPALAVQLPRRALLAALGALGAALALAALAPQRFLSLADLALLRHLVSTHAEFSAPALALPDLTISGNHEALAGLVVAALAGVGLVVAPQPTTPRPVRAAQWAALALAAFVALPWLAVDDPEALGFRLRLAAFVPLALAAALAARLLVHRLHRLDADVLLAALALALVLRTPTRTVLEGEVVAHPAMVAAVAAQRVPPATTVVVPERQVAFMVAYYTRAPVSLRPVPTPSVRMIALHWMGDLGSPLDQGLERARHTPGVDPPLGTHPGYANGLVQITERTWAWLLEQLPLADRAYYATWPTI